MNPNYTEFKFPQIKAHPWHKVCGCAPLRKLAVLPYSYCDDVQCHAKNMLFNVVSLQVFHKRMPPEAVDLVSRLLQYSPNLRCTAVCKETPSIVIFVVQMGVGHVLLSASDMPRDVACIGF